MSDSIRLEVATLTTLPHDAVDLFLAPVALAVDARIAELGSLPADELALAVGVASDLADWTPELRDEALLRAISHLIDTHGWTLSWDGRGLRLAHGPHQIVLGVPASFVDYRTGSAVA